MYWCDLCNKGFKEYQKLNRHMRFHVAGPENGQCTCLNCKYGFMQDLNEFSLDKYRRSDELDLTKITVCTVIPYKMDEMAEINEKFLSDSKMRSYTCKIDGQQYTILIDLEPYSMYMNNEKIEAKISNGYMSSGEDMSFHSRENGADPDDEVKFNLYCSNECDGECPCKKKKRRHPFKHKWELAYGCEICGEQFKDSSCLASHMKIHIKKVRKCKVCDKMFSCKSSLKMHLPTHSKEEVANCSDNTEDMNIYESYTHVLNLAKEVESESSENEIEESKTETVIEEPFEEPKPVEEPKEEEPEPVVEIKSEATQTDKRQHKRPNFYKEDVEEEFVEEEIVRKTYASDRSARLKRREEAKLARKEKKKDRVRWKTEEEPKRLRHSDVDSDVKKILSLKFNGAICSNESMSPESTTEPLSPVNKNEISSHDSSFENTEIDTFGTETDTGDKKRSLEDTLGALEQKLASQKAMLRSLQETVQKEQRSRGKGGHVKKRYQCQICFNRYVRKNSLQRHILTHSTEKNYHCDLCDKSFSLRSYLTSHRKIHFKRETFTCRVCYKQFNREYNLKAHMMTHNDFKAFSCRVCGKEFNHASNLKRHEILHTGLKLNVCMLCGKSFSLASGLKEHMSVHEMVDERPYRCDLCNKTFREKAKIRRHTYIHIAEPRFACLLCDKKFHQKGALKRHAKCHGEIGVKIFKEVMESKPYRVCVVDSLEQNSIEPTREETSIHPMPLIKTENVGESSFTEDEQRNDDIKYSTVEVYDVERSDLGKAVDSLIQNLVNPEAFNSDSTGEAQSDAVIDSNFIKTEVYEPYPSEQQNIDKADHTDNDIVDHTDTDNVDSDRGTTSYEPDSDLVDECVIAVVNFEANYNKDSSSGKEEDTDKDPVNDEGGDGENTAVSYEVSDHVKEDCSNKDTVNDFTKLKEFDANHSQLSNSVQFVTSNGAVTEVFDDNHAGDFHQENAVDRYLKKPEAFHDDLIRKEYQSNGDSHTDMR